MEHVLLPHHMLAITTTSQRLLKEEKLQLLRDLCHHPRALSVGGEKRKTQQGAQRQIFIARIPSDLQTFAEGN